MKEDLFGKGKLDTAQAIYISVGIKMFNILGRAMFSFRHPILDWNRCYGNKIPLELKIEGLEPGATSKVISRVHYDNLHSYYFYTLIAHNNHPDKYYAIKVWNDTTKEEQLALNQQAIDFFTSPFALSGYKPNPMREITAKPHKEKQATYDPRYGTYQSNN